MSIITKPRKSSKAAKPFSCEFVSIVVRVCDHRYNVDPIPAGEFGTVAYRFTKHAKDDSVYDVIRTTAGIVECTCMDYESRHRGNGYGMCKHGRALVELGLMAAPLAPEFAAPAPIVVTSPTDSLPAPTINRDPVTVNGAPIAPARNRDPITVAVAPAEVEPAPAPVEAPTLLPPEPCCSPVEAEPCRECVEVGKASVEALPVAKCVCSDCQDAAECVAAELEDAGPAEAWGPEWDIDAWMLGADAPEPEPDDGPSAEDLAEAERGARELLNPAGPPTLTLAELCERQVQFYLAWQTDAGDLIAGQLDQLASRIRFLDAKSPSEFIARGDVLDRDDREGVYRAGFDAGVAHARSVEVAGSAFGHSA